jgi:chromosome segregation ATPase
MQKIISLVAMVAIFGLANFLLWGAQELYWRDETNEIEKIDGYLDNEKPQIELLKSKINEQSSAVDVKKQNLEKLKDNLKNNRLIDQYNSDVDNYNSLLNEYKSSFDKYEAKLSEYNTKVNRVNELVKKSSSRWYIIPIPLPSKSIKSTL